MADKVSVVIPVYNSEKYVKACLKSVQKQDHTELEIIIVNDGSTDSSAAICENLAKDDRRIQVIHQKNQGVSSARNCGLMEASGKYICFVDSDDLVKENHISNMLETISMDKEIEIVFGTHSYLYENRTLERVLRWKEGIYKNFEVLPRIVDDGTLTGILFGSVCGALYTTEFLKKNEVYFDENIIINEDGIFNIKAVMQAKAIFLLGGGKQTYLYRQDDERRMRMSESELKKKEIALRDSTKAITAIDGISGIDNIECQLRRRELTVKFWIILNIVATNMRIGSCVKHVKNEIEQFNIQKEDFDLFRMNRFKKILFGLISKRKCFTIVFLLRYIYPIAQKFVKR